MLHAPEKVAICYDCQGFDLMPALNMRLHLLIGVTEPF